MEGYQKTVLDNGIRIVTEEIPYLNSVSIGVWVTIGSRDEQPQENGISHFLEHLLFKGTERRTAFDIAREIDSVGGVLNAFTTREYTSFYAKVINRNLPLAIDLLTDIFLHPLLDPQEVEKERKVILEEIRMVEDAPEDHVHDLFQKAYWGDHPLGFPVLGSYELLQSLTRNQLYDYFKTKYQPGSIFISAAGRVNHQEVVDAFGKPFGRIPKSDGVIERLKPRPVPSAHIYKRDLEQVYICLGVKGLPQNHPLRFAAYVLNTMLGGGMSSRLFQEIREKRGLAYSIYSYLASYSDNGVIVVYAGMNKEVLQETIGLILKAFNHFKKDPLDRETVQIAKEHLKGNLLLSLESSDNIMTRLAKSEIYFDSYLPVEQMMRCIDDVKENDIQYLANELFDPGSFSLTALGPADGENLEDLLKSQQWA